MRYRIHDYAELYHAFDVHIPQMDFKKGLHSFTFPVIIDDAGQPLETLHPNLVFSIVFHLYCSIMFVPPPSMPQAE